MARQSENSSIRSDMTAGCLVAVGGCINRQCCPSMKTACSSLNINCFPPLQATMSLARPNLESDLLHLGCGLHAPPDWLNVDGSMQAFFARWPRTKSLLVTLGVYPKSQANIPWPPNVMKLNLRKRLPFKAQRFRAIYSSHTFEHLYRA